MTKTIYEKNMTTNFCLARSAYRPKSHLQSMVETEIDDSEPVDFRHIDSTKTSRSYVSQMYFSIFEYTGNLLAFIVLGKRQKFIIINISTDKKKKKINLDVFLQ